ncbi:MAG TPA: S41 family peptidase [Phycisphaerales bacterium]|nr:S41 family peptidase [Phycisphaerales bacterium]
MAILRRAAAWSSVLLIGLSPLTLSAQPTDTQRLADRAGTASVAELSAVWNTARSGDIEKLNEALQKLDRPNAADNSISDAATSLARHIEQREQDRAARTTEVRAELDKHLATQPMTDIILGKALRNAIELHLIAEDKDALLREGQIKSLTDRARSAAADAEKRGDVVAAGELFVLLDALYDVPGTYRADVRRIIQRQEMLRLYVPEKLYNQRAARARAMGNDEELPPYNPFGDDYTVKTKGIDEVMILRAAARARQHIEQKPINSLVVGGLEAIRTMMTTPDLVAAFPNIGNDQARQDMLSFIDDEVAKVQARADRPGGGQMDQVQIDNLLDRLTTINSASVKVPKQALLHEFGNGMMAQLDEHSAIIWPDELHKFIKSTEGRFVGIGVQIEYDELFNIRVVTPLEGTPAQKAGIHPGDIIKEVNGHNLLGLSLDQAVEVITGPEGTEVTLTLGRPIEEQIDSAAPSPDAKSDQKPANLKEAAKPEAKDPEAERKAAIAKAKARKTENVTVKVKRSLINVASVKGWKREGIREDQWDWFVDKESKIGYVRLLQFSESTVSELDRAVAEMKRQGVAGLVFDLRNNPGGLLDQAVKVSQRFIRAENAPIVMTQGPGGVIDRPELSEPSRASLADIPVVCLVNESSASASEIVSGALSVYGKKGMIDAVVLGSRSYGKGSVQNVWPLAANARMKVTTAYYMLPDKTIIHRRQGAKAWGVEPDLKVEMLPKQMEKALVLRRNADVRPINEKGEIVQKGETPNPEDLIQKGIDLQLETALMILRAKTVADAAQAKGVSHAQVVK